MVTSGIVAFNWRQASIPLLPDSMTSRTITSGRPTLVCSSSSATVVARPTISQSPLKSRSRAVSSDTQSSAKRTRGFVFRALVLTVQRDHAATGSLQRHESPARSVASGSQSYPPASVPVPSCSERRFLEMRDFSCCRAPCRCRVRSDRLRQHPPANGPRPLRRRCA